MSETCETADYVGSLDHRNEGFIPPVFDPTGGTLGVTPILWQIRMAYPWLDYIAEESPNSDQCCEHNVFAISKREALDNAWRRFKYLDGPMPDAVASCYPVRFRNNRDEAIEARVSAQFQAGY